MPYTNIVLDRFKGLNLTKHVMGDDLSYARYSVNMDYGTDGALIQRGGFTKLSTVAQAAGIKHMIYRPISSRIVTVGPGEVNQYDTGGVKFVPTGTPTWAATAATPPAPFGLATLQRYIFIPTTNAGAGVQYRRLEDNPLANDAQPGTLVAKPQFMAAFPGQNRMAYAGFYAAADAPGGANGTPGTVFFSDPFLPETVGATHFQTLEPGDGDRMTGVVGYQNQLFVFKAKTLYVFYGVSPDDDGEPLFDFRSFPLPDPIPQTADPTKWVPVCVGPDGVYFHGSQGLWKTTGSAPQRVTTTIDSFFTGDSDPDSVDFFRQLHRGEVVMGWVGERLFINYTSVSSGPQTLIWNRSHNAWGAWSIYAGGFSNTITAIPVYSSDVALYTAGNHNVGGNGHVWQQQAVGKDLGSTVTWTYQTAYSSLGFNGEKRLRFIDLYGQGSISLTALALGRRAGDNGGIAKTAAASAVAGLSDRVRYTLGLKGRQYQLSLSGSDVNVTNSLGVVERLEIRYAQGSDT